MAKTKRRDKSRVVLRTGESQRADGTYHYSWTDANRKRRYVYAKTLDELRYKEEQIEKDKKDGIKAEARYTTLNDMYELWRDLKRGLKNNTFENYKYMYETFVRNQIGSKTVSSLKKTDIKRFYNYLADERHLKPATIDNIHTVLHQILDMAVDDDYLRNNPSNNVLKELKQSHCFQTEKRRALTRPEQEVFLSYLKNTPSASLWYPIFAVLVGTGLRVGEATGLRWCDIDLEEGIIDVNHTLVYYDHRTEGSKRGCYFNINTTKTPAGKRQVPMLDFVKEAFLMEKESDTVEMTDHDFPAELEVIDLKGHFFDMIGICTPDNTVFLADCISSKMTLDKYQISFIYDVEEYFKTLDKVEQIEADMFVPAHADASGDVKELVQYNRAKVFEIISQIKEFLSEPMCFEALLKKLFDKYNLVMNFEQYVLVGSTVRSYLSYLKDKGEISAEFKDNQLIWKV